MRSSIAAPFALTEHVDDVARLLKKYGDVLMSLADACLVRMSEIEPNSTVFTLDEDFHVYRRHGRRAIPLLFPRAA